MLARTRKLQTLSVGLLIALALFIAGCQTTGGTRQTEGDVKRAWHYGYHQVPQSTLRKGQFYSLDEIRKYPDTWQTRVAETKLKPGTRLPAVIYLHGCSGFRAGQRWSNTISELGYAFFAPDSLARPRKSLCRTGRMRMMTYRIPIRKEELRYALQQLRKADWIDQKRIILMGFSEGAQAASAYRGEQFAAVILVGTDCRFSGGSPAAPNGIPVLNIVGSYDEFGYGAGCSISKKIGGSKRVVLEKRVHDLSGDAEARELLERFLEQCCARSD